MSIGASFTRLPQRAATYEFAYDHLVVALGATTNMALIPGSENALTFKTMVDALVLRNHHRAVRARGRSLDPSFVAAASRSS